MKDLINNLIVLLLIILLGAMAVFVFFPTEKTASAAEVQAFYDELIDETEKPVCITGNIDAYEEVKMAGN